MRDPLACASLYCATKVAFNLVHYVGEDISLFLTKRVKLFQCSRPNNSDELIEMWWLATLCSLEFTRS